MRLTACLAIMLAGSAADAPPPDLAAEARQIVKNYLEMPAIKNPKQKRELLQLLAQIKTPASAEVCRTLLTDQDEWVKHAAIDSLGGMAKRVANITKARLPLKPEFEPAVKGVVPYLIAATGDRLPRVRSAALRALVRTAEARVVDVLRKHLNDPDEHVQFLAACRLTWFKDATGLPVMRRALTGLRANNPPDGHRDYGKAKILMEAFERITGKSFGRIPVTPMACSSHEGVVRSKKQFEVLLSAWDQWWNWKPKPSEPTD